MLDMGIQDTEQPAAAGTDGGRRPTDVPAAAESKIRRGGDPVVRVGRGKEAISAPSIAEAMMIRRLHLLAIHMTNSRSAAMGNDSVGN